MKLYFISRRFRRLNLPGAMLIALLQRTPMVRVAAIAESVFFDSPVGSVVRSVLTAVASLGAVQSMAGATPLQPTSGSATGFTVATGTSVSIAYSVVGTDTPPLSWRVTGSIPPGLNFSGLTGSGGLVNVTNLTLTGTPTAAATYNVTLTAYEGQNGSLIASPNYPYQIVVTGTTATLPTFTTQPQGQTVSAGATVTFSAAATGSPAPTYQWKKDGADLSGATTSSLTLTNVQSANQGTYTLVATNTAGSTASSPAILTVNPIVTAPVFTLQPIAQTIVSGSSVVFRAAATDATSVRWQHDGVDVSGATSSMLVIRGATSADAGGYTMIATNSGGSTTSNRAALSFAATTNSGRLINLSILTAITPSSPDFIVGTVVGGGGTIGNKAVLVRAGGPSLAQFQVDPALADPRLDLKTGQTILASNDDWGTGGVDLLSAVFNQVGAFAFNGPTSKDAAVYAPSLQQRDYTVLVSGVGSATGGVIAELYDATPSSSYGATTPRLINVSVNKPIDAGATLTAGFVVGGDTARTVLIRVVGPGLRQFGLTDNMPDPQLVLNNITNGTVVAANDNWGGDPQLSTVGTSVAAFSILDPTSRDAMLLITLPPANYTVQASDVAGVGGRAIVEVYEVP
jgi:hypothetical protein